MPSPTLCELLDLAPVYLDSTKTRVIGYRVQTTLTHHIEVHEMIFNWRVVAVPRNCPLVVDAAYCFIGKDVAVFFRAVDGAKRWNGTDPLGPPGWDKNATTGEWNRDRLDHRETA